MLRLCQIQKTFNRGTPDEIALFRGFDLTVEDGSFVSIVGSNGSGKSTLLNLICGTLPLDGGTVELSGQAIEGLPEYKRARHIGRVYQDPAKGTCGSMTILENLSIAANKTGRYNLRRGVDKRRVEEFCAQVEPLGLGLENKLSASVGSLSGGQRQALSLLLATMTPIDLLILDEHTAALDPKSSQIVMELTDRIVRERGVTTLMVTHNLRFAVEHGSRLLMMHQGEAVRDLDGEQKAQTGVEQLVDIFSHISIELGN